MLSCRSTNFKSNQPAVLLCFLYLFCRINTHIEERDMKYSNGWPMKIEEANAYVCKRKRVVCSSWSSLCNCSCSKKCNTTRREYGWVKVSLFAVLTLQRRRGSVSNNCYSILKRGNVKNTRKWWEVSTWGTSYFTQQQYIYSCIELSLLYYSLSFTGF